MKKIIIVALASLMMTACYKEDLSYNRTTSPTSTSSNSSSSSTSHYCGYPTKKGPCKRLVSSSPGYCWQHK